MVKKPTVAELLARIAELEGEIAALQGGALTIATTQSGQKRYTMGGVKKDGLNYTPSAVDAIRTYTWPLKIKGVEKKEIVAALIANGFTPATVRARVKRIFEGTDESCYSEAIRTRLGLDELEADADEENEEGDE